MFPGELYSVQQSASVMMPLLQGIPIGEAGAAVTRPVPAILSNGASHISDLIIKAADIR
jgi:hypothetical protein